MQSSAQLNAPVQHLATSTPVMNSQQQYMQMLNSPILSPSLNQADVHNVPHTGRSLWRTRSEVSIKRYMMFQKHYRN